MRKRTVLFESVAFEVVSIEWSLGDETSVHQHGWSECSVLIESGVFEDILDLGAKTERRILKAGEVSTTPVGAKHEIKCLSEVGKTLHVYTPKIKPLDGHNQFKVKSLNEFKTNLKLSEPTSLDGLEKALQSVRDHSISTHSPYFMNQLFSGVFPQMLMAESLIAELKTTLATSEASPALSAIEEEVIEALGERIGWDAGKRHGVNVPGGSAANFMALHCARQNKIPGVKERGSEGARFKVFVSEAAHYSFQKACTTLGIGTNHLIAVRVDQRGRMRADHLETLLSQANVEGDLPLLVAATAGTTVFGAFDPVVAISVVCKKFGVWLHVDAAWGGPAIFSKSLSHLVSGIDLADSVTFDAHKLFGANLTSSFFLTQHSEILFDANDVAGGEYLFHSGAGERDLGRISWQCGRKADAASFWTIWKSLGTDGLGHFVDRLLKVKRDTLVWLADQPRLQLIHDPDYLNVCLRVVPPTEHEDTKDWSRQVRERLKEKNLAMVNYSNDEEGSFLRLILAHPYLEFSHVKQILEWALEIT